MQTNTEDATSPRSTGHSPPFRVALVLGALGVVFGDIGTSPIYTLQTLFDPADPHPVPISTDSVYGVVSLIFWSVMIIVTLTYITLVMRADNDGEGGIMALITMLRHGAAARGRRTAMMLAGLGLFGASLFFGDSMITPAISVLSAIEGIKVVTPDLEHLVVPITAVIIVTLFTVQRHGTAKVGRFFGPVMIVWFLSIGGCGVLGIVGHPEILKALSPTYALSFMFGHFHIAFFALAAVVLAVTGAEALYADMGHFGRRPITLAWLFIVLPSLALNYLGQGALLLGDENSVSAPFFLLIPGWARLPMVLLATAATIIASQAVITGAFSVAAQAAKLGLLPRLRVVHTSASAYGQVYVPAINWMLMVSVLILVFAFESSAKLAYAYGMAVIGTITIVTGLFFYLARTRWGAPLWMVLIGGGALLLVDLLFLAANLTKLVHGAWLPLLIAVTAWTVMMTWERGRTLVTKARETPGGVASRVHRRTLRIRAAVDASPRHRRLPQPGKGDGAAGHARQRRPQPRPPRPRGDHDHRDRAGTASAGGRPGGGRRPRLCPGRNRARHSTIRIHGALGRTGGAAPAGPHSDRGTHQRRRRVLLPLEVGTGRRTGTDHGAVAEAPVHRHLVSDRRRCRLLPPAARPDGGDGLTDRVLSGTPVSTEIRRLGQVAPASIVATVCR